MKTCTKCGESKPLTEFYSGSATCKQCYRQRVRDNRQAKIDYYQAYDRDRADLPERVETRKRVAAERRADPVRRSIDEERGRCWRNRNFVKRRAHVIAGNAIRDGYLVKPDCCQRCGSHCEVHAHHEDYYRPLEVTWLCRPCHSKRHREINEEIRNGADLRCRGFDLAQPELQETGT